MLSSAVGVRAFPRGWPLGLYDLYVWLLSLSPPHRLELFIVNLALFEEATMS